MIKKVGKTYDVRAYWRDLNGTKHSKYKSGFKTLKAAQEWESGIIDVGQNADFPDAHRVTVSRLRDMWIDSLERDGRSPKTIAWYKNNSNKIIDRIGGMIVQDVKKPHIQTIIDDIRDESPTRTIRCGKGKEQTKVIETSPLSASTIDGIFRTARSMFNYAIDMGIISNSPAVRIKRPAIGQHEANIYTAEQLAALMSIMSEQLHPLLYPIYFCVYYGMRRGEALGLRWCDIDFETGAIHIRGNLTSYYDEADGREHIIYKSVKTKFSDATVAATEQMISDLKKLKAQRFANGMIQYPKSAQIKDVRRIEELDPREFICWNEQNKLFRPEGIRSRLQCLQKANDLPICTVHDLRHTYGTLLTEQGVDVAVVSKALRHSSIKITADTYVDPSTKIKQKATQIMADIINMGANKNCAKIVPELNDVQND